MGHDLYWRDEDPAPINDSNWHDGFWVHTYRGHRFDLDRPSPSMVDHRDLAHHLAQICRYAGSTPRHYSVAQHCVLASMHIDVSDGDPIMLRRYALVHDAEEAYTNDMPRPWKRLLKREAPGVLERLTQRISDAVMDRFGLPRVEPTAVKTIDRRLCVSEKRDIKREPLKAEDFDIEPLHSTITPWPSVVAEEAFLKRFQDLGLDRVP